MKIKFNKKERQVLERVYGGKGWHKITLRKIEDYDLVLAAQMLEVVDFLKCTQENDEYIQFVATYGGFQAYAIFGYPERKKKKRKVNHAT